MRAGGWNIPTRVLQFLAKVHAPIDDLEAQCLVAALRELVVNPSIGRHLHAAVAASPRFGGGEEPAADTMLSIFPGDIPTFEIADGERGIATIGV